MADFVTYNARAVLKYKPPPGSGGLVLVKGDVVEVLGQEDDEDFLRGRKEDGTEGVFPADFVEAVEGEEDVSEATPSVADPPKAVEEAPKPVAAPPRVISPPAPAQKPLPSSTPRSPPVAAASKPAEGDEDRPMSFKERLAAFNKPAAAAAPPVPRAKPAAFQRKPAPAPTPAASTPAPVSTTTSEPPTEAAKPINEATGASASASKGGMSAEDAASSIKAGGGLKARMAALQSLNLEGPGPPGRPPKPRRKPTTEDIPLSPAAAEDEEVAKSAEPESAVEETKPIERHSTPPVTSAPSMAMPAVPRRAGPPRRKAPVATASPVEAAAEGEVEASKPVPLETDTTLAARDTGHMASDPAAGLPANEEPLGAASEEPGGDIEAEAAGLHSGPPPVEEEGEDEPTQAAPAAQPMRPPPPPRMPSESDEEEGGAESDTPLQEPVFRDESANDDPSVVPAFSEDQLDDDQDRVLGSPPLSDNGAQELDIPAPSPSLPQRAVPSPRGPRAFGSGGDPTADSGPPVVPSARPPAMPAPFVRQDTDEPTPPRTTGRLPPIMPIAVSTEQDSDEDAQEELVSPRGPPSRRQSKDISAELAGTPIRRQSVDISGDFSTPSSRKQSKDASTNEQAVPSEGEGEEEEDVDPEVARRQALAKRMAALGGVKMGMMPVMGRPMPPRRQASTDNEEPRSAEEPEESASPPPRRMPGLPAGAVPIFGMARPAPPAPIATTEEALAEDPRGSSAAGQEDSPPMSPISPRGAPPPIPAGLRPPSGSASEDEENDAEEAPPVPPPRPTGGHAPRTSMDEERPPPRPPTGPPPRVSQDSSRSPRTSLEYARTSFDDYRSPVRQESVSSSAGRHSRPASSSLPPGSPVQLDSPMTTEPREEQPLPSLPQPISGTGEPQRRPSRPYPTPADLGDLSERIGASLAAKAQRRSKEGAATKYEHGVGFVSSLIEEIRDAAPPPTAGGGFGFCLWSSAAQSADQATMVRPGDVLVTEGALAVKIKGKSLGASSTSLAPGYAAVVVEDYDAKKRKVRVVEVNEKGKLELVGHHLDAIKQGTLAVYRVLDTRFA